MKMLLVTASILILMFSSSIHSDPIGGDIQNCCISHISKPIPFNMIKQYYFTSEQCSKPAVIFTITRDRQICANPELSWVKRIIEKLNQKTQ